MKKFNALTLAAILSIMMTVILASVIATSPIEGSVGRAHQTSLSVPF